MSNEYTEIIQDLKTRFGQDLSLLEPCNLQLDKLKFIYVTLLWRQLDKRGYQSNDAFNSFINNNSDNIYKIRESANLLLFMEDVFEKNEILDDVDEEMQIILEHKLGQLLDRGVLAIQRKDKHTLKTIKNSIIALSTFESTHIFLSKSFSNKHHYLYQYINVLAEGDNTLLQEQLKDWYQHPVMEKHLAEFDVYHAVVREEEYKHERLDSYLKITTTATKDELNTLSQKRKAIVRVVDFQQQDRTESISKEGFFSRIARKITEWFFDLKNNISGERTKLLNVPKRVPPTVVEEQIDTLPPIIITAPVKVIPTDLPLHHQLNHVMHGSPADFSDPASLFKRKQLESDEIQPHPKKQKAGNDVSVNNLDDSFCKSDPQKVKRTRTPRKSTFLGISPILNKNASQEKQLPITPVDTPGFVRLFTPQKPQKKFLDLLNECVHKTSDGVVKVNQLVI
jgi:hypothetical protein